jgi:hypothetical protein
MKSQVRDREIYTSLEPLDLAAYLRSSGWKEVETRPERSLTWMRLVDDEPAELLLPLDRRIGDFAARMADVVGLLAAVEERSQQEILADLRTSLADVVRIQVEDTDTADGTLPLEPGAALIDNVTELMRAAARATLAPRASYPERPPRQVEEFVRGLRLGQTERDGFTLTLLSRLPPRMQVGEGTRTCTEVEEPFERRVTQTLAQSLLAVREAAIRAATDGTFDGFRQGVSRGVSANLCAALVGMCGSTDHPRDLTLSFTWSRQRPVPAGALRQIRLERGLMPTLAEAARIFLETSTREAFEVSGVVVRLDRAETAQVGRVTLLGFVAGQPHKVGLELAGDAYELAIRAHQDRATVRCVGELRKVGRGYTLDNPRQFALVPEEAGSEERA